MVYIDPFDGGTTYRYALSSQLQHTDPQGTAQVTAFGFQQYLNLTAPTSPTILTTRPIFTTSRAIQFTCTVGYTTCNPGPKHLTSYISYCPANRVPSAAHAPPRTRSPRRLSVLVGDQREQNDKFRLGNQCFACVDTEGMRATTFGIGTRNDNIAIVGLFSWFTTTSNILNGTLSLAHVTERDSYAWMQNFFGSVRDCSLPRFACRLSQL